LSEFFAPPHGVLRARLLVILAQGLALFLLARWFPGVLGTTWPAFKSALLAIFHYAPMFAVLTIGNLRPTTGKWWIGVLVIVCGVVGFHRGSGESFTPALALLFSVSYWFNVAALAVLVFVGHVLVAAGDADRRRIATFPTYFDVAWRLAAQFLLAIYFAVLVSAALTIASRLFQAIGIDFLTKPQFTTPVTAMAASVALHFTDSRPELVRNARAMLLGLLSWLMPMMTVIAVVFILALPFTGLKPLFTVLTIPSIQFLPLKTGHATGTLLATVAILILLINSQYQDGRPQDGRPEIGGARILTFMRVPAALVLMPLVMLAAYGLCLRVEDYGWTASRVIGAAMLVVAFCHALGYAVAALSSGSALRYLPVTNIASAFVLVILLLAVLTPVADPARLAVASQVPRLESGALEPEKFDFKYLATQSGQYGKDALHRLTRLKDTPNAGRISHWATRALTLPANNDTLDWKAAPATTETRTANIKVLQPPAAALPDDFLREDWAALYGKVGLPSCLTMVKPEAYLKCEAVLFNLTGTPGSGIILLASSSAWGFGRDAQGKWKSLGMLQNTLCPGVRDALRAGRVGNAEPAFRDIDVNGVRLPVTVSMTSCPQAGR
jgi:hypothetical protein